MKKKNVHNWKFVQTSGLVQVQLNTIDDVLNLKDLDPKLWTALACPVKGLEFNEETLNLLDEDKNGRVRINEVLSAVDYIKKYFAKPEIIMEEGQSIPLECLNEEKFACGNSPLESAKAILKILNKPDAAEITLDDLSVNDKLISPGIFNGDGILPAECVKDDFAASVVKDIITVTGGSDDISGVKGITRDQKEQFFTQIREIKNWREAAVQDDPKIFFLKNGTDAAAKSFMKMQDKINDYFLRCSLIQYDGDAQGILKTKTDFMFTTEDGQISDLETLAKMPLALPMSEKPLPLDNSVNPAWLAEINEFKKLVILPIFQKEVTSLQENHWRKIVDLFTPYVNWYTARPENGAAEITLDRIVEILNSNAEETISSVLAEEEAYPSVASASVELRKMLLLRRDFLTLLKNFVSFADFYDIEKKSIFQAGTLYIDGRSCELCFKVLDAAKHGVMAALSQCYLLYCDCANRANSDEKMQIAALISAGSTDNLMVGRNGIFYDRKGQEWDATITKIIDNPISIRQAFWSPYKKLARLVQEKLAKKATDAESKINEKMSATVNDTQAATKELAGKKKIDLGTIAAIGVAVSGFASVVGTVFTVLFAKENVKFIPLILLALILIISLPSMFIAWTKLRKRNIAPMLDASGWAINGNVKISTPFGAVLTHTPNRPAKAFISRKDPFAAKKFPIKRVILGIIVLALLIIFVICGFKFGFPTVCKNIGKFFTETIPGYFKSGSLEQIAEKTTEAAENAAQ